ncbi:TPR domain protein [Bacteroides pyogenes DSM 20611 = JCM 6294]|uniref:TPR domain protein n=1 Tax=Bacteroides pyogenes DSM 20611 = JCM 6294 TaxID=1121100 RepID=W4PF26_9BACE|nr:TPR domain protein [Bacteroides pyogenes DSM 20611 = JCM 6294]
MAEQKNQNEHLNVEDALTQSEAFLIKYKKAIIGGVAAIVIIVAGIIMYKNLYAEPREEKAQAALFKGQEYFEQDAYDQALNGDSIGFTGFLRVADEYSGTKAANLAKGYAGICYAQLGKYDEAIKMLDSFNGKDQMVAPAISERQAIATHSSDSWTKQRLRYLLRPIKPTTTRSAPSF